MSKKGQEMGLKGMFYLLVTVAIIILVIVLISPRISEVTETLKGILKLK